MAAPQPKSKSYAAFGIIAAIVGLAYWHPSVARIIPPANVILARNTARLCGLTRTSARRTALPASVLAPSMPNPCWWMGALSFLPTQNFQEPLSGINHYAMSCRLLL